MLHCAGAIAVVVAIDRDETHADRMAIIYKIERKSSWSKALEAGRFDGSPDDRRDGYIHFSTADQLRATTAKYFAGFEDLVLAAIDADSLGPLLKWEAARGGALFPHLYAALPMTAVLWTKPLPLDSDGRHVFPVEVVTGTETH
jgi:uncharacterized protein (DUF952 family)